jgi:hypothetical protein
VAAPLLYVTVLMLAGRVVAVSGQVFEVDHATKRYGVDGVEEPSVQQVVLTTHKTAHAFVGANFSKQLHINLLFIPLEVTVIYERLQAALVFVHKVRPRRSICIPFWYVFVRLWGEQHELRELT